MFRRCECMPVFVPATGNTGDSGQPSSAMPPAGAPRASPRPGYLLLAPDRAGTGGTREPRPYQPAEGEARVMPDLLNAVAANPPRVFVIQTRGPLIVRDIDLLRVLAARTTLRVSFSITTDSDSVRRIFEPGCSPISERWQTVAASNRRELKRPSRSLRYCPAIPRRSSNARPRPRAGHDTGRGNRGLCSPRLERVAGSGVSALANAKGRWFGHGPAGFGLLASAGNIA